VRIRLLAYAGPLPAVACSLWLLWQEGVRFPVSLTWTVAILGAWLGCALALTGHVRRPLQTASNLLSALREGDFSVRAVRGDPRDPLSELYAEINLLGSILHRHRLNAMEATALAGAVMEAIDVAVFAFDEGARLRLVNPAGQRLLGASSEDLLGRSAGEFNLAECLGGDAVRVLSTSPFQGHPGTWGMRRCLFREDGRPHTLIVLADLGQTLRAEQAKAWQSLVRVLGHELNNSLTPIKSIAGSLGALARRPNKPADWEDDLRGGLDVIAARAEGLTRFMQAYSRLARLPQPVRKEVKLFRLVQEAMAMERRVALRLEPGPDLTLCVDSAQVGQVLVNLLHNAAEAMLHEEEARDAGTDEKCVEVSWAVSEGRLCLEILDEGHGISNSHNLFVPFFTTKPDGSGIGLVLSRQIIENHGGSLSLENRVDGPGCVARITLPLA